MTAPLPPKPYEYAPPPIVLRGMPLSGLSGRGLDYRLKHGSQWHLLAHNAAMGYLPDVREILAHPSFDKSHLNRVERQTGNSILGKACWPATSSSQIPIMLLLLEAGADPNCSLPPSPSPLWIAAEKGYTLAVELLLTRGAKLKESDPFNETVNETIRQAKAQLAAEDQQISDLTGLLPPLCALSREYAGAPLSLMTPPD